MATSSLDVKRSNACYRAASAAHVCATEQKTSEYTVDSREGIVGPPGITNYVDEEFLG